MDNKTINTLYEESVLFYMYICIFNIHPKFTLRKAQRDDILKDAKQFFKNEHNASLLKEHYMKVSDLGNANWDKSE